MTRLEKFIKEVVDFARKNYPFTEEEFKAIEQGIRKYPPKFTKKVLTNKKKRGKVKK